MAEKRRKEIVSTSKCLITAWKISFLVPFPVRPIYFVHGKWRQFFFLSVPLVRNCENGHVHDFEDLRREDHPFWRGQMNHKLRMSISNEALISSILNSTSQFNTLPLRNRENAWGRNFGFRHGSDGGVEIPEEQLTLDLSLRRDWLKMESKWEARRDSFISGPIKTENQPHGEREAKNEILKRPSSNEDCMLPHSVVKLSKRIAKRKNLGSNWLNFTRLRQKINKVESY